MAEERKFVDEDLDAAWLRDLAEADEAYKSQRDGLAQRLLSLLHNTSADSFVRRDLGKAGFPELMLDGELMRLLLEELAAVHGYFPHHVLQDLNGQLDGVTSLATAFRHYRPGEPKDIGDAYRKAVSALHKSATPLLAWHRINTLQAKLEASQREALAEVEKVRLGLIAEQEAARANNASSAAALEAIRSDMSTWAVQTKSKYFQRAANRHQWAARGWLCAAAIVASATIYFAVTTVQAAPSQTSTPQALSALASHAVVLTVLLTILIQSVRAYRGNRHNAVVNEHRVNAVETFLTFVEGAAGDPDVKRAILLQASTCVFSPQSTGFAGSVDTEAVSATSLVDVAKLLVTKAPTDRH